MDDEANFFAMPPPAAAPPPADDAPILLGEAPPPQQAPPPPPQDGDTDFGVMIPPPPPDAGIPASGGDAAFLGDVNDAGSTDGAILLGAPPTDAPILLGAPSGSGDSDDGAAMGMGMDMDMGGMGAVLMEPPVGEDVPEEQPHVDAGPSPMQKWNTEWQETLMTRKDAENARKGELVEESRLHMEKFQQEREQRRENKMAKNREDEQAKLEAIEADLENDNSWQRVCKMIELSHDSTAKAQDTKRMRDVLILLKNETARAELLT